MAGVGATTGNQEIISPFASAIGPALILRLGL